MALHSTAVQLWSVHRLVADSYSWQPLQSVSPPNEDNNLFNPVSIYINLVMFVQSFIYSDLIFPLK